MRRKLKLGAVVALAGAASIGTVAQADSLSVWAPAQKIDEIDGNSTELNTPAVDGCPIQSPDEQGPSYLEGDGSASLYFSSSSATVPGDIYVSEGHPWLGFGPATPVAELNDATANDIQPNVRSDGREVVLSSNRAGTTGGQDIWVATRRSVHDTWSQPVNLGASVNTAAAETRPSLSWRGRTLLFGRAPGPEGMSDIYVTTRERVADE